VPDAGRVSTLQRAPSLPADQTECGDEHDGQEAQAQGQQGSRLGQGQGDGSEAPRERKAQIKMLSALWRRRPLALIRSEYPRAIRSCTSLRLSCLCSVKRVYPRSPTPCVAFCRVLYCWYCIMESTLCGHTRAQAMSALSGHSHGITSQSYLCISHSFFLIRFPPYRVHGT
jgi:hypothetical protein